MPSSKITDGTQRSSLAWKTSRASRASALVGSCPAAWLMLAAAVMQPVSFELFENGSTMKPNGSAVYTLSSAMKLSWAESNLRNAWKPATTSLHRLHMLRSTVKVSPAAIGTSSFRLIVSVGPTALGSGSMRLRPGTGLPMSSVMRLGTGSALGSKPIGGTQKFVSAVKCSVTSRASDEVGF